MEPLLSVGRVARLRLPRQLSTYAGTQAGKPVVGRFRLPVTDGLGRGRFGKACWHDATVWAANRLDATIDSGRCRDKTELGVATKVEGEGER